jgi:hypothetical protein
MTQRLTASRSQAGGAERKLRAAGLFLPSGNHLPMGCLSAGTVSALLQLVQEMQS